MPGLTRKTGPPLQSRPESSIPTGQRRDLLSCFEVSRHKIKPCLAKFLLIPSLDPTPSRGEKGLRGQCWEGDPLLQQLKGVRKPEALTQPL